MLFSFFKFFAKKEVSIKDDIITWDYSFFILKFKRVLKFSDYSGFELTAYNEDYQVAKWKSKSYFNDDIIISLTRSLKDVESDLFLFKAKVLVNKNLTKQNKSRKLSSYDNIEALTAENKLELKDLFTALFSFVVLGVILYNVFSFIPVFSFLSKSIGIESLFFLIPVIVFLMFFRQLLLILWEIIRLDKIIVSEEVILERKLFFIFKRIKTYKLNDFVLKEIKNNKENKSNYILKLVKNTDKLLSAYSLTLFSTENQNDYTRYMKDLELKYPYVYDRLLVDKLKDKTKEKSILITTIISMFFVMSIAFFNFVEINNTLYLYAQPYYGERITYYNDGVTKNTQAFYINGKPDGKFTSWYYEGQKESEFFYENNEIEGKLTYWHKNGKKKNEVLYRYGLKEGIQTTWHENGQKEGEFLFENGLQDGKTISWTKEGFLKKISYFKEGKRDGSSTTFYKNGKQKEELIYENGKLIKTTKWSEEGEINSL